MFGLCDGRLVCRCWRSSAQVALHIVSERPRLLQHLRPRAFLCNVKQNLLLSLVSIHLQSLPAKVSDLTLTLVTFLRSLINYRYNTVADCWEGMKYIERMWYTTEQWPVIKSEIVNSTGNWVYQEIICPTTPNQHSIRSFSVNMVKISLTHDPNDTRFTFIFSTFMQSCRY